MTLALSCAAALLIGVTGHAAEAEAAAATRQAAAATQPSPADAGEPNLPRMVPWVEFNEFNPRSAWSYDALVAACRTWQVTVDMVCVTTEPRICRELYTRLAKDLPGVRILPGIKTSPPLQRDLDRVTGWRAVGQACATACQLTGSPYCVIDNETGWDRYIRGEPLEEIDWSRMRECFRQLPVNVHYIWYPACWQEGRIMERQRPFLQLMAETLERRSLVSFGWARPPLVQSAAMKRIHAVNQAIAPTTDIVYFMGPPRWPEDWNFADVPLILREFPDRSFLAYPGAARFQEAATQIGRVLRNDTAARLAAAEQRLATAEEQLAAEQARTRSLQAELEEARATRE